MRIRAARPVCDECPVRAECLASTLLEESGQTAEMRATVRGGLSPRERYALSVGTCGVCGADAPGRVLCGPCQFDRYSRANKEASPDQVWKRTCIQCGRISSVLGEGHAELVAGVCGTCRRRAA